MSPTLMSYIVADGDGLLHFFPIRNTDLSFCFVLLVISSNYSSFACKMLPDHVLFAWVSPVIRLDGGQVR